MSDHQDAMTDGTRRYRHYMGPVKVKCMFILCRQTRFTLHTFYLYFHMLLHECNFDLLSTFTSIVTLVDGTTHALGVCLTK